MTRRAFTTVVPVSHTTTTSAAVLKMKTVPLFSKIVDSTKEVLLASNRLEIVVMIVVDGLEVSGMDLQSMGESLKNWFDEVGLSSLAFTTLLTP